MNSVKYVFVNYASELTAGINGLCGAAVLKFIVANKQILERLGSRYNIYIDKIRSGIFSVKGESCNFDNFVIVYSRSVRDNGNQSGTTNNSVANACTVQSDSLGNVQRCGSPIPTAGVAGNSGATGSRINRGLERG